MLRDVNELHARARPGDLNLRGRMDSFETARGLMREAPEVFDLTREPDATLGLYGIPRGDNRSWAGRGESTASQTAWALLAVLAAGGRDSLCAERGVAFLTETQTAEGTWDEPWYTGTGFPGDFYINYHLYRLIFPVQALGRFVHGTRGGGVER